MLETMVFSARKDGIKARAIHGRADLARDRSGQRGQGGQAPWVSQSSIYACCMKFGQHYTDEVKCLKGLEQENARLRKLLVDRDRTGQTLEKRNQ